MNADNMSSATVRNIMNQLEVLNEEAMCNTGTGILKYLNYINIVMKEINRRRGNRTINIDEIAELSENIYDWLASFQHLNTSLDRFNAEPRLLDLIPSINSVLRDMIKSIEKNFFFKNFCLSYEDHVKQIESCQFNLRTYDAIIAFHNLHSIARTIIEDRENSFNAYYGSSSFNGGTPIGITFLQLCWDDTNTHLTLLEGKECTFISKPINSTTFHVSFFNILTSTSSEVWLKRKNLADFNGDMLDRCTICLSDGVPTNLLTVLSSCRHIFCSGFIDKWYEARNDFSCPTCRTVSPEYIRATGYKNLLSMLPG